jgi:hypothetical protein
MGLLAPKIHDLCQLLFTLSITGFWKTGEASLIIVCNCEQIEPVFLLLEYCIPVFFNTSVWKELKVLRKNFWE